LETTKEAETKEAKMSTGTSTVAYDTRPASKILGQALRCAPGHLRRLGIIMDPNPANPQEVEGVLNPALTRGPDGQLYLLPRLVAAGNYSRIGLARVVHDRQGDPHGVERLGVVLEPQEPYERNSRTGGGVEDPRVTYLAALGAYVMTYTAYGEAGPRIALALSHDLVHWRRRGPVQFAPHHGFDLGGLDNKDALLFPEPVPAPDGRPALALIHRPDLRLRRPDGVRVLAPLPGLRAQRPSMWLSYAPLEELGADRRPVFGQHHLLAGPQQPWERLKVGGGTPPLRVGDAWLVLYHGVTGRIVKGPGQQCGVRYSAGLLLLDGQDPRRILYRSAQSILAPEAAAERLGMVPQVVFPTGLDARPDGALDIYYGMADTRIGVARAWLDDLLTPARAHSAA
jgi:predicted GH43/DUF377 family glycosyl hydrolase